MVSERDLWADIAAWLILWHQRRQEELADSLVPVVARSWRVVDFHDLSRTELPWVESVLPSAREAYVRSQGLTADFIPSYRDAKRFQDELDMSPGVVTLWDDSRASTDVLGGNTDDAEIVMLPPTLDERATVASLLAAGPGSVKHRMPAPRDESMAVGLSNAVGAVIEKSINGGREYARAYANASPDVVGWQRITDSDPCAFCALLASRGPRYFNLARIAATDAKYTSDDGDDGEEAAKVHFHCKCSLIPVFDGSPEPLSGWARTAREVWEMESNLPAGSGWKDRRREYRRRYDNFKAKNPSDGVEVDERALRRQINAALRDVSDYRKQRLLKKVKSLL